MYITKRYYKHFVKEEFISEVKKISWWKIYQCEDVDLALEMLSDDLTAILDQMATIRTIQILANFALWLSYETKN